MNEVIKFLLVIPMIILLVILFIIEIIFAFIIPGRCDCCKKIKIFRRLRLGKDNESYRYCKKCMIAIY